MNWAEQMLNEMSSETSWLQAKLPPNFFCTLFFNPIITTRTHPTFAYGPQTYDQTSCLQRHTCRLILCALLFRDTLSITTKFYKLSNVGSHAANPSYQHPLSQTDGSFAATFSQGGGGCLRAHRETWWYRLCTTVQYTEARNASHKIEKTVRKDDIAKFSCVARTRPRAHRLWRRFSPQMSGL